MEIIVDRYVSNSDTTLSRISVDGKFCVYGLEDAPRAVKIHGKTRIPAGRYQVKTRFEGRHYEQYKRLFAEWHRGSLHITDVPGFTWVMIHIGNTEEDTEGCLLVGSSVSVKNGDISLLKSRAAYKTFYLTVIDAAERGELFITFLDNDVREAKGI